jgi:hypothetical protein
MDARTPKRTITRFFVKNEGENRAIPATPLEAWDDEGEDRHTTNVEYQLRTPVCTTLYYIVQL